MGLKWRQDERQLVTIVVLLESKVGLMERKKEKVCRERGGECWCVERIAEASFGRIDWVVDLRKRRCFLFFLLGGGRQFSPSCFLAGNSAGLPQHQKNLANVVNVALAWILLNGSFVALRCLPA